MNSMQALAWVAAVAIACAAADAAWASPGQPPELSGPARMDAFPDVRVDLRLPDAAWTGGSARVIFEEPVDESTLEALGKARAILNEAQAAGRTPKWPTVPESPTLEVPAKVTGFADRSGPEEGLLVGFVVDSSASMGGVRLEQVREIARVVIGSLSRADSVFLARLAGELDLAVPPTTDHGLLLRKLEDLELVSSGVAIFDGLAQLLREELPRIDDPVVPGRRVLLFFSDGKDSGSRHRVDDFAAIWSKLPDPPALVSVAVGKAGAHHAHLQRIASLAGPRGQFVASPTASEASLAFKAVLEPLAEQIRVPFEAPPITWRKGPLHARLILETDAGATHTVALDLDVSQVAAERITARQELLDAMAANQRRLEEYETARAEEKSRQQQEAAQEERRTWYWAGGAAALLMGGLFVGLAMRRSRHRRRKEAEAAAERDRLREDLNARFDHQEQELRQQREAELVQRQAAAAEARTPLLLLIGVSGPMNGQRFAVLKSPCVAGRDPDRSDLAFPEAGGDPAISRVHAELRLRDEGWTVQCLSQGGLAVNGVAVRNAETYRVAMGDHILLGESLFRVDRP